MKLKNLIKFKFSAAFSTVILQSSSPQHLDSYAIKTGFDFQIFLANQLMQYHLSRGDLSLARKVFDEMPHKNTVSSNHMISGYAKSGRLDEARRLFRQTADRTAVTWTIMIGACANCYCFDEASELFLDMLRSGVMPDRVAIVSLLSSCQDPSAAGSVLQIHAHAVKFGFDGSLQAMNTLVDSYWKSGLMGSAKKMFQEMSERDSVTYNAMLNGCSRDGFYDEAVAFFGIMRESRLRPSQFTYSGVLVAATGLGDLCLGMLIHGLIVRTGFQWSVHVINSLIDFYSKSNRIDDAKALFEAMSDRDNVSYNVMISCYAWRGLVEEVSRLFQELQRTDFDRKLFPYPSLLRVAASLLSLETGRRIHAQIAIAGVASDDLVGNALIDMYCRCGSFETGKLIFLSKSERNSVSWTSIISGYVHNGLDEEALRCFSCMRKAGVDPDRATFSSILSAASTLALLVLGMQLHSSAIQLGNSSNVFVGSALLDMYAKCGCLDDTHRAFEELSQPNIVSWNALITACAQNGRANEAIKVFDEMLRSGIEPDSVTFLGILHACSHSGLIEQGLRYFHGMKDPKKEHYACAVDLLGRVGRFDELKILLDQLPFDADEIIWSSVLNSCRKHRNEELATEAAEKLFSMELDDAAPYVIMSNIYSQSGRWSESVGVKKMMRERGIKKEKGCSWVEVNGNISIFSTNDETNSRIGEIRAKLEELEVEMERDECSPDTSCSLRNISYADYCSIDKSKMKFKAFLTQDGVNLLDKRFLPSLDKIGRICHLYLTRDHAIFLHNLMGGDGIQSIAQFKTEVLFIDYRICSQNEDRIAFAIDVALLHRALSSAQAIQLQSQDTIAVIQIKLIKKLPSGSVNPAPFLTFETKGLRSAVVQDVPISKPLSRSEVAQLQEALDAAQDLPRTLVQVPDLSRLQNLVDRLKNIGELLKLAITWYGDLHLQVSTSLVTVGSEFRNLEVLGIRGDAPPGDEKLGAPARMEKAIQRGEALSVQVSLKHLAKSLQCHLAKPDSAFYGISQQGGCLTVIFQFFVPGTRLTDKSISFHCRLPVHDSDSN